MKFARYVMGLLMSLATLGCNLVWAASMDQDPNSSCSVRIHYPSPMVASPEVFVMGVGTAMARSSYDVLSSKLVAKGYVVAIMDHQPGSLTKTDAIKYANCAQAIKDHIGSWLVSFGFKGSKHWIMGGHSAGGQAAQDAISSNPSFADAIFSLDPYNANNAGNVKGPGLYWGFDTTTCFVNINDAAKAAYYKTSTKRMFVRARAAYSINPCGYAPKYYHCSFCDGSCPACTSCMKAPTSFYVDVANSVQKFINAAFYGSWSKANLKTTMTTPTDLFVDGDTP